MAKPIDIASISGPAAFWAILWEAFSNIGYFGIGMVVIVLIAGYLSWWFAFILFVGFAAIALFSVLHQLVVFGTNIVYLFSLIFGRGSGRGKAFVEYIYLTAANLVQIVEMCFMVVFTMIIYENLFP